jgi:cytochrome c-type biogenesis protein
VSRRAVMLSALMFVFGFSTVFVALGASASLIGGLIRAWSAELSIVAGIVIIVMGLHFLGLTRIGFLMREGRLPIPKPVGMWGAYVMGLAFAFGWTPCIGPILAAILSVAASEATVAKGAGLLAVYSAGLGIPFLIAAFMIERFSSVFSRMKKHLATVERAMGVLMILVGIGFLTGMVSTFSIWLLETFPALQNFG